MLRPLVPHYVRHTQHSGGLQCEAQPDSNERESCAASLVHGCLRDEQCRVAKEGAATCSVLHGRSQGTIVHFWLGRYL